MCVVILLPTDSLFTSCYTNRYCNAHIVIFTACQWYFTQYCEIINTAVCSNQYLLVSLEVVVEHIDTDGEISSVEWVGTVPSLWSKLSTFHYHRMKVDQGEENTLELILTSTHLKSVLLCVCEGGGGGCYKNEACPTSFIKFPPKIRSLVPRSLQFFRCLGRLHYQLMVLYCEICL